MIKCKKMNRYKMNRHKMNKHSQKKHSPKTHKTKEWFKFIAIILTFILGGISTVTGFLGGTVLIKTWWIISGIILALKLASVITFSWWWVVLMPILTFGGGWLLLGFSLLLGLIIAVIIGEA